MKVSILTEGGKKAGFGHAARCCAIYDAFEKKGISPELIVNGDSSIKAFLKGKRFKVFNWLKKQDELSTVISNAGIVIVDSYLAGLDFYKKLSNSVKIPVYLDDNSRLKYPRSIIVNGAVYAEKLPYLKRDENDYLLGTSYTPLQKTFWKSVKKRISKRVKSILVTFGGAEADELIFKVLGVLSSKYPKLDKKIVTGKKFSAQEMKNLMMGSDIAISGGGQTLYELARIGVPTIAVATAENQSDNIKGWERIGFIKYAGRHDEKNLPAKLVNRIDSILDYNERVKMSSLGRSCIDGKGASNLVEYILERSAINKSDAVNIELRKADKNDCHDLWLWRNHPNVRNWSFNKKEIRYKDHKKWFNGKIRDPRVAIYIGEDERSNKIGQVRFEEDKGSLGCVYVNLNPLFFGKGLGSRLIQKATHLFMRERPGVDEVIAEIIDGNRVSKKAFKKSGYVFSYNALKENDPVSIFKYRNEE
jgi:UDP-2,4-diacetamido-2,4,6-trideoxy-beta-L-altropyranose hydrolase